MSSAKLTSYLLLLPLFFSPSQAYFESPQEGFKGKTQMNGIKFEKYRDFPSRWKLVTVRFREDSREMRLTYANEAAFRHLEKGLSQPYPDGAIFGKVSFKTEHDPAFTSSEVPTSSRRYQLMVKDSKRFKEQDGWGYALFDSDGLTFDEDPKIKVQSCHACHQIVKDSNFVFSELAPFAVGKGWKPRSGLKAAVSWDQIELRKLPEKVQSQSGPQKFARVHLMKGPMSAHFFSGTLDEVVPALIEKSAQEGAPAVFLGDAENFSLVIPIEGKCHLIKVLFKNRFVREEKKCVSP